MKFKIGQTVRCINEGLKGAGWKLDRDFLIHHITQSKAAAPIYWETRNGREGGVYEDSLLLIHPILTGLDKALDEAITLLKGEL